MTLVISQQLGAYATSTHLSNMGIIFLLLHRNRAGSLFGFPKYDLRKLGRWRWAAWFDVKFNRRIVSAGYFFM